MKKQRRHNPTKAQKEAENKRFKEYNEKHGFKLNPIPSNHEHTTWNRAPRGNRE